MLREVHPGHASGRPLVLVSVPYLRVARILLSGRVLAALEGCDVVVAAPFADDAAFRAEYGRPGIGFLRVPPPAWERVLRTIYSFSESMRMTGFWRRYRADGLAYYWKTVGAVFARDGRDTREGLSRRLFQRIAAWFGSGPRAWRVLDRLFGRWLFGFPRLEDLARGRAVTLLQASSWGPQDRMLAWQARRLGFRTVLVPYTTDQLWVNGYLMCDYDAVCVQGEFEEQCARRYHAVPDSRIVRLGSMWFRAIDDLRAATVMTRAPGARRVVLYAGVSPVYFPRDSEFAAVAALLAASRDGRLANILLVYRPYALDTADRAAIEARFGGEAGLELQWPEEVCAGLETYSGQLIAPQLLQYLRRLAAADVMVMSHTTSLAWDSAYLGSGIVANFADPTGTLERRGARLRFANQGLLDCAPGLPVSWSIEQLVEIVAGMLRDPQEIARSRDRVLSPWDYPGVDSLALLRAVFREPAHSGSHA